MGSEGFCKRLEDDLLLCPICYDTVNQPRTLPCQHSFCHTCLHNYWTSIGRKSTFRCPSCQAATKLRRTGIACLPINDLLNKLKELVSHLREHQVHVTDNCQLCGGRSKEPSNTSMSKLCLACVTDSPLLYLTRLVRNRTAEKYRRISSNSFQKLVNSYRLGYWIKNSQRFVDRDKTTELASCHEDGMTCFEIRKCTHASYGAAATNLPTGIGPIKPCKHETRCSYKSALFCTKCYEFVCRACEELHETHPLVLLYSDITRYSELFSGDLSMIRFPKCEEFTSKYFIENEAEEIEGLVYRLYVEQGGSRSTTSTASTPITSRDTSAPPNGCGTDLLKQTIEINCLTCPKCNKARTDLRVLPCQHSVCSICLQGLLLANIFRCPVCEMVVKGLGEIQNYSANRALSELREIMASECREELVESDEVEDMKAQNCTSCNSISECCLDVCCGCLKRAKRTRQGLSPLLNNFVVTDKVYKKICSDMKDICVASLINLIRCGLMKCQSCHQFKDSSFYDTCTRCSRWMCSECTSCPHEDHHIKDESFMFMSYVTGVSELADKVNNIKRTPAVFRPLVDFGKYIKLVLRPKGGKAYKPRNISKSEIKLIYELDIIRQPRYRRLRTWLNKFWELKLSDFLLAGLFLLLINLVLLVTMVISPNSLRDLL